MNRENLIKLQDVIARNNCANADEIYDAFESSPERSEHVESLIRAGYCGEWGFAGLCSFLGIKIPDEEAYNLLAGDAAWLQSVLYKSRRHLTACADMDRPSGNEIRNAISDKLDQV